MTVTLAGRVVAPTNTQTACQSLVETGKAKWVPREEWFQIVEQRRIQTGHPPAGWK